MAREKNIKLMFVTPFKFHWKLKIRKCNFLKRALFIS